MTDLDKARKWAEDGKGLYSPGSRAKAVTDIILSLPDQWVDAENVRELVSTFHSKEDAPFTPFVAVMAFKECAEALESLLNQKLPTLADMTQEEREACQWMQCEIDGQIAGILARVDEQRGHIWIDSGYSLGWKLENITPLPDLPKLKWPGGVVDCEIVDETPADQQPNSSETPKSSIKPEDVPHNEPWLIEVNGEKAIGTRYRGDADVPWSVAALDGAFAGDYNDREITLIHKLVPETHTLPEGMRLADHPKYGRVVTSPWVDDDDDYKAFFLNEDVRAGADYEYAHKSTLTFLDGEA